MTGVQTCALPICQPCRLSSRLLLAARRRDRLEALAKELQTPCRIYVCDVSKKENCIWLHEQTRAHLSKEACYNIIFGERSNGKTYSVLKYAIKHYFETKGQFAIVRRWKEDITGRRASDIFTSINQDGVVEKFSKGKFAGIHYSAGKFYACIYDEDGKPVYNDTNIIGYCFSLSDTEHNKSISYPMIETIFFDEFLTNKLYQIGRAHV